MMHRLTQMVLGSAVLVTSLAVAVEAAPVAVQQTNISYPIAFTQEVASAVPGQPAAKQPVTRSIEATLFIPQGQGRRPAVVFAHDGQHGVSEAVKRRCLDLARQGFVVLAPDYPGDGLAQAVRNDAAIQALIQARVTLKNHPRVKQNAIGLVGTSEGGYLALQTAIKDAGQWNCVVQASGAIDVPSTNTRVQSQVLLQHGDKDRVVLRKHANYLDATLRRAGTSCVLKEYTLLNHNFWFWEDQNYSVEEMAQAEWAWGDVVNFLNHNLNAAGGGGYTQ